MNTHTEHMHHTARELDALPTLAQGQAKSLKIDNNDGVRVWLHRTGIADGENYEHAISVEVLRGGSWETLAEYDGGELDDDEDDDDEPYETFTLTIDMGNAAMCTLDDIARALDKMQREGFSGVGGHVRDENGNTVGKWELT